MSKMVLPGWAISDDEVQNFLPDNGFIRDYMDYMSSVTDAPMIYHLGSVLALLSMSCPYCDVKEVTADGDNIQPIILWIALIGYSGDRKSTAMDQARGLLERFRMTTSEKQSTLIMDGSTEAWHDHLVKNPNTLIYKDELSQVFDVRGRGYMAGVTGWLLELYSGNSRTRIVKKRRNEGDEQSKDDEVQKTIERPRVSILGGIPPETLTEKATSGDWSSGFLARFKFFCGMRESWKPTITKDQRVETELCKWLLKVPWRSRGVIKISKDQSDRLSEWIWQNVEIPRRQHAVPQNLISQLTRLQEFGARASALYAMSRQNSPQTADGGVLLVDKSDIDRVLLLLDGLKRSSQVMFDETRSSVSFREEKSVYEWLVASPDGMSIKDLRERFPQMTYKQITAHLIGLTEQGVIKKVKGPIVSGTGRPPYVYVPTKNQ